MTGKWRNLIDLYFILRCVLTIGLPLALWIFSPDDSISLKLALSVLALLLILLAFSGRIAYQYYQRAQNILPKLILAKTIENMGVICLFEPSEAVLKLIPDVTHVRRFVMLSGAEASFPPELVRDELLRSHARFTRLHTPLLRLRCAPLSMTGQ